MTRVANFSGLQFLAEKREKSAISRRENTEKSRKIIVLSLKSSKTTQNLDFLMQDFKV